MFKKTIVVLSLVLLSAISYQLSACNAQGLSSTELINNAKAYDGKIVAYEGEVIGDIMKRGANAWVNINDADNAIGVWVSAPLLKDVIYAGSYKSFGDKVEVTGIFNRACAQHGGDLDIHAQSLRKVNPGRMRPEKLNPDKINQVIILAGVLILIWTLSLLKRR